MEGNLQNSNFRTQVISNSKRTLAFMLPLALTFWLAGCTIEESEQVSGPSASVSQQPTKEATQEATEEPEATEETTTSKPLEPGTLRISFLNWDETTYPKMEIWIRGHGSWFPTTRDGDLLENVGSFELGNTLEGDFFVYPFGRDGIEIPVTLNLSSNHISSSVRDMVLIYIEDGRLFVSGSPIVEDLQVPLN